MRTLIILLVFGLTSRGFAQTGKLFRGTLNSTKITLYLEGLDEGTNADPIVGAYNYENRKGYLLLNGYRDADGNIILVEQDTPNFSGIFLDHYPITRFQENGQALTKSSATHLKFVL